MTTGAPSVAGFAFTRDLTVGARGDDVSALQQFLISGGFLNIPSPTGYFGSLTRVAVRSWQAKGGIYPAVGFFGPISRRKIGEVINKEKLGSITLPQSVTATTTPVDVASSSTTTEAVTTSATTTVSASTRSADGSPVRFTISKLGIDAGFQYNGLKADGAMDIPNNIVDVGWFTGSARPGEQGTSVVTGHVAQIRGGVMTKPGVFSNLSQLRAGDRLSVLNDKGEAVTFVVRESRSFDPSADATEVFSSADGKAHLNLITCEGIWNPEKLSYSARLVVFTDKLSP